MKNKKFIKRHGIIYFTNTNLKNTQEGGDGKPFKMLIKKAC